MTKSDTSFPYFPIKELSHTKKTPMKIYFSHGKESGPWGSKIKHLASIATQKRFQVESIDYTAIMDPDIRVEKLLSFLQKETEPIILVGSSMGGYVSLVASEKIKVEGVFLLAPALYIEGYKKQGYITPKHIEIVHGWSDEVIPFQNSIRYAESADCTLHLISGDHRLNSSIEEVVRLFSSFLDVIQIPNTI